jgi:hypothetical protein
LGDPRKAVQLLSLSVASELRGLVDRGTCAKFRSIRRWWTVSGTNGSREHDLGFLVGESLFLVIWRLRRAVKNLKQFGLIVSRFTRQMVFTFGEGLNLLPALTAE